jgi:hypothetical protein
MPPIVARAGRTRPGAARVSRLGTIERRERQD